MAFGLTSCSDGKTPYIGENGNWWIDNTDLGVPAQGPTGEDGASITVVSVKKTSSSGLVDTYTITFSDGTSTTFTVTNGEANSIVDIKLTSSSGNIDTYTIYFSNGSTKTFTVTNGNDGKNGKDGKDLTITSIELKSSEGLIDTYVITYSDGSKFEFVVSNGADGLTPYIGENGNWWIGDTDTGVVADYEKAQNVPLTDLSDGLTYEAVTINGKSGFVVSSWDDDLFYAVHKREPVNEHLVIPNYVGSVPVIGVKCIFTDDCASKITLSRNTTYLWEGAFKENEALTNIDFNGCSLTTIPESAFEDTSLVSIELPSSVTRVEDRAFDGVPLRDANIDSLSYIGKSAFECLYKPYVYLSRNVEYVGSGAFYSTRVYIEHESIPSNWGEQITSSSLSNGIVNTNCKKSSEYIYSINDGQATVYQYLGANRTLSLPNKINGYPLKTIGYGFGSVSCEYEREWLDRYNSTGEIKSIIDLDEVLIPEGVTKIEDYAFYGTGTFVKVPASIETVSSTFISTFRYDDILECDELDVECGTNYLAFRGSNMPTVLDNGHPDSTYTKEYIVSGEFRVIFDADFSKIVSSGNGFYFKNNSSSYSLIAYMGLRTKDLVIPSTFSNKKVTTIERFAIPFDESIETIVVQDGVETIRNYGIIGPDYVRFIMIPDSISIINNHGVCVEDYNTNIFVEADSKPMDWDSNWTNYSDNACYGVDGYNDFFAYSINGNKVELIKYIATSLNVYIPKTISGKSVTSIRKGFVVSTRGLDIYIPSNVTNIEYGAFQTEYGRQYHFYCEVDSKPDTWDSNFVIGSGSKQYYWNQSELFDYKYNDEYAYRIIDSTVELCAFAGNQRTIRVPRTIEGKNVDTIIEYCFVITRHTICYIPKEMLFIENYGFARSSGSCDFYCEAESKPENWQNNWKDNNLSGSIYYNQELDY